jgi:hypothetical protein
LFANHRRLKFVIATSKNVLLFCLTLVLLQVTVTDAQEAEQETIFVRVLEDEQDRPLALQLAIVSYVPRDGGNGIQIDLVGAIHIGDEEYYQALNERFESYDAILYELIAPKDTVISDRDPENQSVISSAQVAMKNMLALSFQLDEVNYGASNFVHADLSPTELSDSMDERGESLYVYFWRLFYASFDQYAKDPLGLQNMSMFSAMLSADSDNAFKTMLAYEMTDLEKTSEFLGDDSQSAVIGARNQRAVDVLKTQLESGDKHIAIFYGVAHMPDMEERLLQQLDLVYLDTTWVAAWRLDTRDER